MSTLPTVRSVRYPPFAATLDRAFRLLPRPELTPAALQARADRATGLSDPAPEEVAEPLARLCADFAAHPPTALGARVLATSLGEALANRRRIAHAYARRKPPAAHRPIIIIGWHRTGTTFLHDLIGSIPGLRFVPFYRLMTPVRRWNGFARAVAATRLGWRIAPEMPVLHPQAVRGADECWVMTMASLRVEGFGLHWETPSYSEWFATCDQEPYASIYTRGLALLSQDLGGRLVMKDAAHMMALPALLAAQPDACFVWTHRDPMASVASFASLSAIQHRSIYGTYDAHRVGRVCVDWMAAMINTALRDRGVVPPDQMLDIGYSSLMKDPVGVVARICDKFGVPFDANSRAVATENLERLRSHRPPPHRYTAEQWGIDPADLKAKLANYPESYWKA